MIRKVLLFPDAKLKQKSVPVTEFNEELLALATDLRETEVAYHGLGLAAPQVEVLQRVIVVRSRVMVNPVIVETRGDRVKKVEGCLSFPNVFIEAMRFPWVRVKYQDLRGFDKEDCLLMSEDVSAHVVQHEVEHLDGMLISDHMSRARRGQVMGEMRKLQRQR